MDRIDIIADNFSVKDFLTIVFKFSNRVSISRHRDYEINDDEFDLALTGAKEMIQEQITHFHSESYRQELLSFVPAEDIDQYIADLTVQELDFLTDMISTSRFKGVEPSPKSTKPAEWEKDFIAEHTSFKNEVTLSASLFDSVTYHLSDRIHERLWSLPSLYDPLVFSSGADYEDLAFYNDDHLIGCVCSHEEFALLHLLPEEYEHFKELIESIKEKEPEEPGIGYLLSDEALEKLIELQSEKEMTDSETLVFLEQYGRQTLKDETPDILFIPSEEESNFFDME